MATSGPLIYLASPYGHPFEYVRTMRFDEACLAARALHEQGHMVYSPIAHCHPIATIRPGMPTDFLFWGEHNRAMLERCDEYWILTLDGWGESEGIAGETAYAHHLGRPVRLVDPLTYAITSG